MKKHSIAMALLLTALAGCASAPAGGPTPERVPGLAPGVHFSGGDGSSQDQAVVVLGATEMTGVPAEYLWLQSRFPGYKRGSQSLLNGAGGKSYDVLEFTTPDGAKHTVYFDISDYFGKM